MPGRAQSFRNYEIGQTRPITVSRDGSRLYALNTPDNRLAVYSLLAPSRPVLVREIPVGLEPVAVVERSKQELWVVNNLGDSISVVDVARGIVIDTIQVGDEPMDVVFAGSPERAFVSVATDREVRVFDPVTRREVGRVAIFGDEPRWLATDASRKHVWVAVHRSGNKTTILPETEPTRPDPPRQGPGLPKPPKTGMIVRSDDPQWKSVLGVNLPDIDVVEIDAGSLKVVRSYAGVGTSLFEIAVDPQANLWVANTDARNIVRFEPNLRGHVIDSRVTRIVRGQTPQLAFFDLNSGVDYGKLPNDGALASALSQPTGLAFSPDGKQLFVAAFGTDRVGVLDANGKVLARIEVGDTPGTVTAPRRKRGPRGVAHHPARSRLYVLNRLSQSITVLDTANRRRIVEVPLVYDPTPPAIRQGRGFLYDAKLSGNGTMACASCHVDGMLDGLAWDLGDPNGRMFRVRAVEGLVDLHPMKGPLTTQTLRGLGGTGPFHWRGDRPRLEDFNGAFASLLAGKELSALDMASYVAFLESIEFPPNPNQNLDRTFKTTPIGESAADGAHLFSNVGTIGSIRCVLCHALPSGTNGTIFTGQTLQTIQPFKVPQLRNVYKRLGRRRTGPGAARTSGFGLLHEGSVDDVFDLLSKPVFRELSTHAARKRTLQRFVESFDTGTAPAVGHQITVTKDNVTSQEVASYFVLMLGQAARGNADLTGKGLLRGRPIGLWWSPAAQRFLADRQSEGPFTLQNLSTLVRNGQGTLTFTGTPPGSGRRIGIDRDLDGTLDGDEGLEPFGQATPIHCSTLQLDANSMPDLGNGEFAFVVRGAMPNVGGLLLVGGKRGSFPIFGVTVLVGLGTDTILLPVPTDRDGVGIARLPIPDDPALDGIALQAQALYPSLKGCTGPHFLAASQGLSVRVAQ